MNFVHLNNCFFEPNRRVKCRFPKRDVDCGVIAVTPLADLHEKGKKLVEELTMVT